MSHNKPRDLKGVDEAPNIRASFLVGRAIQANTRQKISTYHKNAASTGSVDDGPKSFHPFWLVVSRGSQHRIAKNHFSPQIVDEWPFYGYIRL